MPIVCSQAVADDTRYTLASHLVVLRNCPGVISKLLKSGGPVLLAAKVLVLSRLLHTKLSQHTNPPPYLDTLRIKLSNLRRRILTRVDRRFKSFDASRDVLLEAMCAFALATSSSAKDCLRHFHHIRQDAMVESISESGREHECILRALRLYTRTMFDTQAVIPKQLSHALEKLKTTPLFKDQDVNSLMELSLDVHRRWISEDIKMFTPYIRHDDLSREEAERLSKQWAKQTLLSFLSNLRKRIQDEDEPQKLMQLRRQILEMWLSNHHSSMGINATESLDGLREVFNTQATRIIQRRVAKLDDVGTIIIDVLQHWQPGISDSTPSLWDSSMTSIEITNGGKVFRDSLTARCLGKNQPLDRLSHGYMKFLSTIEAIEETLKNLRETRWADDIDDVDEDEDMLDNKQVLLSEDDPRLLQDELNLSLGEAYSRLEEKLGQVANDLEEENSNRGHPSCFLLRVLRELRQHLPSSYQNQSLGLVSIPKLQQVTAQEVLLSPMAKCSKRIQRMAGSEGSLSSRPLWEGEPQLPVLPSPWTYRLLLELMASMTAFGSDVWSPQTTDFLKKELIVQMTPLLKEAINSEPAEVTGHADDVVNGIQSTPVNADPNPPDRTGDQNEEKPNPTDRTNNYDDNNEEPKTNKAKTPPSPTKSTLPKPPITPPPKTAPSTDTKIQLLFDTSYLINATTIKDAADEPNELISFKENLMVDLALDFEIGGRIKRDAASYWKRTGLLFGLLD